jgi:iron complex outermembrane receptor protein
LPIKGNVGVRFVSTEETASGYSPNLNSIEYDAQGSTTVIPDVTAVTDKHSYNNVLPNLNVTYSVTPKLLLRLGIAETMTRADLSQLAPNTTVSAGVQSISEGNPDLKPYTALQFDGSAEWYFAKTGLISVALFDKQVKNFIQNASFTETLNVKYVQGGGTIALPFSVFQPVNSTTATSVKGVEFGYQQGFTFLPAPFDGLGALFNYTYITADPIVVTSGQPAVPLSGLSNNNYNLVGYYEKGKIGVRLAYNYRGNYVVDPSSYFGDGDYRKAYGQLDVSGTFHVTSQIDLTAEALNVTNSAIIDVDKYGINRGYEQFGTTFMLGAHYKFR